ncbi:MAG: 2OG-Fe(II) oxygenase [Alphaproteobacteria bacterium]|nr:2OG-Fe(II) oxygenase [Alphaproteobacteria bacterium]
MSPVPPSAPASPRPAGAGAASDRLYDRITDANLNALCTFLRASGYDVARSVVLDLQEMVLDGGSMSLGTVASVLEAMGVPFHACRYAKTPGIPAGEVALVPLRARRGTASRKTEYAFAIAVSAGPGAIPYCTNGHGEALVLSADQWRRQWSGVAIHVSRPPPDGWTTDPSRIEAERRSAAAYRREIRYVENLIDPELCDDIVAVCERRRTFRRSGVSTANIASSVRTSHSSDLRGEIARRLEARLRMHALFESRVFETFQVVRYRPGEQFLAHIDVSPDVPRPLTAILYLNEDFDGGATSFPNLGLEWHPRKGCALIFPNLDALGQPIEWSLHKAERVNAGRKYACNIWTR